MKKLLKNSCLVTLCMLIVVSSISILNQNVLVKADTSQTYSYLTQWGIGGSPFGIAFDKTGNIYVSDYTNNRIEKFSSTHEFITSWGSKGPSPGQFNGPTAIAIDNNDNIYVSDSWNHRIQVFSSSGAFIRTWGSLGTATGQFNSPAGLAFDKDGNLYVADNLNGRVQVFTSEGTFIKTWSVGLSASGMAIDSQGNIYSSDWNNLAIKKYDSQGNLLLTWGSKGSGDGQFIGFGPIDFAVDYNDYVYVTDAGNNRVQKFDSNGLFITTFGTTGNGNGQLLRPWRLAVDSAGTVFVTDAGNNRIEEFTNDHLPPVIVITSPVPYGVYAVNSGQTFSFTVTDNMDPNPTVTATVTNNQGISCNVNSGDSLPSVSGVWQFTVSATDEAGLSSTQTVSFVTYDSSGGFVTGGGWFNSLAGAYTADLSLAGKANFGFVSKYHKGASVPDGQTEFQLNVGNLNFHSSSYDWLVVNGAKAQFKGSGTINGDGAYGFILTAIDGNLRGNHIDTFRIKIWEANTGAIVYDNQRGVSDSGDPTTAISGGSIIIHK
jgi:sugar lactone lactonase YvrE